MNLYDIILLLSMVWFSVVAVLHEVYGRRMFMLGVANEAFGAGDTWIPTTPRQNLLLGVFFVTSFVWWQAFALMTLLVLTQPPYAGWGGVISLVFTIPQVLLVQRFIGLNAVGKLLTASYLFHIVALVLWTVHVFTSG